MAATTSQGKSFGLFLVGLTTAVAGIAFASTSAGVAALITGLVVVGVSFAYFLKIKPEEGKVPDLAQPVVLKLAGAAAALAGWLVVLFGIHATTSIGGRLSTTIVGLAITLFGVLVLLPSAANKNAIWKA